MHIYTKYTKCSVRKAASKAIIIKINRAKNQERSKGGMVVQNWEHMRMMFNQCSGIGINSVKSLTPFLRN